MALQQPQRPLGPRYWPIFQVQFHSTPAYHALHWASKVAWARRNYPQTVVQSLRLVPSALLALSVL